MVNIITVNTIKNEKYISFISKGGILIMKCKQKNKIILRTILSIAICICLTLITGTTTYAAETITRGEWIHTLVSEMELTIDDGYTK